ncbi:MAG: AMP-binding protein [Eubacterium sp.]|nr:AMP-binding protein [Eubacterium sp.]
MYDTLIQRIFCLAEQQPEKPAVVFKKERVSYKQLAEQIRKIGTKLSRMGIKRGERVLFTALSKPETVAAYLGIQYCGAIAVFVDKNSTPENAALVYRNASAVLFLTDRPMKGLEEELKIHSLRQLYASEPEESYLEYRMPEENETAELLFTTGTTGMPKGVILTYKSVYHILSNTIKGIGIREDERLLLPLPLNHSFALRVLRAVLYKGATAVLQNGFAFAREVELNQSNFDCTAMVAVPASMEILRGQMQDRFAEILSKFRYIEVGAGSLTLDQKKRLTSELEDTMIYNTWGSSETGGALFLNVTEAVKDPVKIGAVGKPLPGVRFRTLDENGKVFQSDKDRPGRMSLKGDMQMAGYWNQKELTEATLKDGWLLTSDMVYADEDGYVYMTGRADDIINVGGEKVSPIEVENIAGQYEHVRECACIGVADPEGVLGQVPILFVVAGSPAFGKEELQTYLASQMERYKLPQHYCMLQELPRNRMGKIDRRELREIWAEQGEENLMNPVMQAIFTRRSIRKFTEEPIPKKILEMILQAGYYAPTGHNMQSWRFTVIQDKQKIDALREATKAAAKANGVYCYGFEQPVCLILISNDIRNGNGCQDASCAAENIFLAAHSYGIGSVWLNALKTLRNAEPVKELLDSYGIPENHTVWCMAALGYPVAEGALLAKKKDVIHYV